MMRARVLLLILITAAVAPQVHAQTAPDLGAHWAEERVALLLRRGIVQLFPDRDFYPNEPVTRAEFAQWLVAAAGVPVRPVTLPSFVDVPPYHPAAPFIEAGVAAGIIPRGPSFLPDLPETRIDAVAMAVRALGDGFEATVLAMRALPFEDAAGLPDVQRGAIAVAMLTQPVLLAEPPAALFRPLDPITRAEAASLAAGVLLGVENGLVLRSMTPVAAGVEFMLEKRGVLRVQPVWRVQVGAFTLDDNAQRLGARMRVRNLPVVVDFQDGFYKVRVGAFTNEADAAALKAQLGREGYPTYIVQTLPSFETVRGPARVAAVILDPAAGIRLLPAVGDGGRMRRQRTSEIAQRTGALAATNGGFFSGGGDPLGCLMISGELLSKPDPDRSCAGITSEGTVLFDRVRSDLAVVAGEVPGIIDGVNRERHADELILYRPVFDATTRTNNFGAEAVIQDGVVTAVADLRGNTPIPRDGFVLSGHGRGRRWILQALQPGTRVSVQTALLPASGDPRWMQVVHAVGGGPRLLAAGQVMSGEGFPTTFTDRRHPRTAIGVMIDGRVVLLVADGRQPSHSLGMTLLELAMELREMGVIEAMNLDGGGSSTLVVNGRLVNLPSDETGERPVADALLVLPPQSP